MPWLALPFGHENLLNLQRLLLNPKHDQESTWSKVKNNNPQVLFIKPKGKSFVDPYGYQVLHMYGPEVYPFTRQAALLLLKDQLKCSGLTFESYVNQAHLWGLDFTSLVRRSNSGGTEEVLLSTIRERSKNIMLLFVSYIDVLDEEGSDQCLQSFIDAYSRQKQNNKFEVIFVSVEPSCVDVEFIYDEEDIPSFDDQISGMPWFSFHKQLMVQEHKDLNERTIKFDFTGLSHFIAFGPADDDLKIGLLPKSSLANYDFPFMNDASEIITEDLRLGMDLSKGWLKKNWCVE